MSSEAIMASSSLASFAWRTCRFSAALTLRFVSRFLKLVAICCMKEEACRSSGSVTTGRRACGPIGIEGAQRAIGGRIRGQAEGTQRAIRGHSEGTQRRRTCSDLWRLPCGASCLGFDLNGSAACSAFGMTSGLKRRVERSMGL